MPQTVNSFPAISDTDFQTHRVIKMDSTPIGGSNGVLVSNMPNFDQSFFFQDNVLCTTNLSILQLELRRVDGTTYFAGHVPIPKKP